LQGWPTPILADSGNGGHLLYALDLPVDDGGLVQRCLEAIAFRPDDDHVLIDQRVYNPARIWKLYGTRACKGDDAADRPHRLSQLIEVPEALIPVPKELLEALAASLPKAEPAPRRNTADRGSSFNIDEWITKHNLEVSGPTPWRDGRKWVFQVCPWNGAHTNRSAYIVQFANGALAAGCHHNGCNGNDWHSLRDKVEPGWREPGGKAGVSTKGACIDPRGAEFADDALPYSPPWPDPLAMIYALLDCSALIRLEHLKAALALWDYCDRLGLTKVEAWPAPKPSSASRTPGPGSRPREAVRHEGFPRELRQQGRPNPGDRHVVR
jgi:hypothetical protein